MQLKEFHTNPRNSLVLSLEIAEQFMGDDNIFLAIHVIQNTVALP